MNLCIIELEQEPESNNAATSERHLKTSSYKEVIKSRPIRKVSQKITINYSKYAKAIIDIRVDNLLPPYLSCPVERLSITKLFHSEEGEDGKMKKVVRYQKRRYVRAVLKLTFSMSLRNIDMQPLMYPHIKK
ncbi:hypothetical protein DFH28DRAFT_922598 [Melampsora americana]|nr:hypothetical protein DFH28DRAFT_922598 [Melampsora americana]